jgi:hypothetical protein
MSRNIDSIDVIQVSSESKPLTAGERQELYVSWSHTYGEPIWFFEQLGDILDKINKDETFREIPDLLMLKIRKLCAFPCCVPIVGTHRKIPVVQDIITRGGASKQKPLAQKSDTQKLDKENSKPSFSILTHFVTSQNFVYLDSNAAPPNIEIQSYASPDNFEVAYQESLDVVGIKIIPTKELKYFNWEIFAKLPGPISLIKSGLFSAEFLNTVLFKPYETVVHKLFELAPGGTIMFTDDAGANEDCKNALEILINGLLEITTAISEWILYNKLDIIKSESNVQLNGLSNELRKLITPTKIGTIKDSKEFHSTSPMEKYLTLINNVLPVYNTKFNSSIWFDLISLGRMDLISRIYLRSIDYEDKDLPKFLEQVSEQQSKYLKSKSDDLNRLNKLWSRKYNEMKFRWFYIHKFGFEKFQEMLALIPKTLVDTAEMRNYIPARETTVIDLELTRDDRFEQTLAVNKEEWVELTRRMRYEHSRPAKLELYKKLRKFILPADLARAPRSTSDTKALKETDYLRSKSGFPIICPHVRDAMELSDNQNDSLRDYLVSNYSTQDTTLDDAYYCRICGEVLVMLDQMGLTNSIRAEGYGHNEDELKKYIWKQVNWLLRAEIEFKDLRSDSDIKLVIRDIVGRIYPFIDQIEKKLLKSKTMTNDEFDNYKRILTIIYTYAIFIRIILDNYKEIKFKAFDFNRKPNVDKMIKYATDQIIDSQNVIINSMKNITAEYIGSMLVKAYDGISDYVGKTKMQAPEPMSLVDYVVADPLYWFLVRQHWSMGLTGSKPELKSAQLALPEVILGQSLARIESAGSAIFEKAVNPLNSAPAWDKKALIEASKSNIDILNTAWYARMGATAKWLLDYTKSGVYLRPVWQVDIEPSSTGDVIKVNKNPDYIKFESTHDTSELDQSIAYLWQTFRCPPYSRLYEMQKSRTYSGFTEDGYQYIAYTHGTAEQDKDNKNIIKPDAPPCSAHNHDWKYYGFIEQEIWKETTILSGYKKSLIVKRGDSVPDLTGYKMIDQYCGICFKAWKSVPTPEIRADIERSQLIDGFYNYYSKVCPEQKDQTNTMHEFGKITYEENGKCKLCGFNKLFYDNKDEKFFKHYLSKFKLSLNPAVDFEQPVKFELHKSQSSLDKWNSNPNITNEFVQITYDLMKGGTTTETGIIFNLNKQEYTNLIANLGLLTGYDYDQIKRGTKNPSKLLTQHSSLIRRTILHSYVQTIIIELSKIVNPSSRDPTLDKILDQMNKADLTKLAPELIQHELGSYYEASNYIATLEPTIQANYTYEYLLQLILSIYQTLNKTKSKYKNDIVIYLTNLILNADESTARIKPQRAAAVEATSQSSKDPNIVDNDHSRMFDTLVDPDASDKYGFEEMDYADDNEEFGKSKDF